MQHMDPNSTNMAAMEIPAIAPKDIPNKRKWHQIIQLPIVNVSVIEGYAIPVLRFESDAGTDFPPKLSTV